MDESILKALDMASGPEEKAALIAESVIGRLAEDVATVARRCVVLHWFDAEILTALHPDGPGADRGQDLYDILNVLPFIEKAPQGLTYHDLTRAGLLSSYERLDSSVLTTGAGLAATVYAGREGDELAAREVFYCQVVAGDSGAALASLGDLLETVGRQQDWMAFGEILGLLDEAERFSFVLELERQPYHWLARGLARYAQGDLAGAIEDYDEAICLNPVYAAAYNNRGLAKSEQGDLAGAIEDYDKAICLNSEDAMIYHNRGLARSEQGDLTGAMADYDEAIRLNPDDAMIYHNRGNVRYDQGENLAGAVADYDEAIRLNPEDATAYYNRGLARAKHGDLTGAVADYDEAIRLNPKEHVAYYTRGNARYDQGDLGGAIADYDQVIRLNPEYTSVLLDKGMILRQLKQWQEAKEVYTLAVEADHRSLYGWIGLADAARELGEIEIWRQALARCEHLMEDADLYDRTYVAAIAGRMEDAMDLLVLVLAEDPDLVDWARKDPELRCLHDEGRFWEIVGEEAMEN